MKNKKVVVTGGMGFIGSNLVEDLIKNNEVTVIDDLSTGSLDNAPETNFDNFNLVTGSITKLNLAEIFHEHDYVFHLAALASVAESVRNPGASNEVNISGTLNVLAAARDAGIKKVVFASSAAVYGNSPELPKTEDMPPDPRSPYAVAKITGEYYCRVFHELYGLGTISLRYFNVFGPRQDPASQYAAVIPKFISAMSNGEQPVIYGDGEQSRDFIFVKHVVAANILACESGRPGVFNIASGKRITVNQLVEILNEILGKKVEPIHTAPVPGDIKHSLADISRAKAIGFNPYIDFEKELSETAKWFLQ